MARNKDPIDRFKVRRPSPAMAVALVALFVSLGGAAIAAAPYVRNGDPAGGDLTGTYPNPTIAGNAVNSAKVLNDSLTGDDVNESTLTGVSPSGAAGGDLTGTYPNPDIASGAVGASEVLNDSLGTGEFSSTIPAARVTHSGAQSIADATTVTLNFDTERYDTAALHDTAVNNSRLTAPVTGIYAVTLNIRWAGNGTGTRGVGLLKNGLTELGVDNVAPGWANPAGQTITTMARLAAGDYVEARVVQTSGGALDVEGPLASERSPEFSMTWLAPGP